MIRGMPLALTLFAYTPEALASLAQNPEDRSAAVRELAEGMGGRLIAFYHSFGEYHGAIIAEVPDGVSSSAVAIAAQSAGHLKTYKTIPLLSAEEGLEALRRAGAAAFRGPGQQALTAERTEEDRGLLDRTRDALTGQEEESRREQPGGRREAPRGPRGDEPLGGR
jgi:uncharacterized protein with GYD domain